MDTGKQNNFTYYEGFEGEGEFILFSGEDSIHIWDGYINDIFGNPVIDGKGWKGLTKDYNEMTGPFAEEGETCLIDVADYLKDAISCKENKMEYEESAKVLEDLITWMEVHKDTDVYARVD